MYDYEIGNLSYELARDVDSDFEADDLSASTKVKLFQIATLAAGGYLIGALNDANTEYAPKIDEHFDYTSIKAENSWDMLSKLIDTRPEIATYLKQKDYLAVNAEMEHVALQLEGDTVLETLVNNAAYVKNHIGMRGYALGIYDINIPESAIQTFEDGTGVCAEHAHLFTALAREQGIPAILRAGLTKGVGHAWVEVPVQTADGIDYLIVDPTNNYIGPDNDVYVHSFETEMAITKISDALATTDNIIDYDSMGKLLNYDLTKIDGLSDLLKDPIGNREEIVSILDKIRLSEPTDQSLYGAHIGMMTEMVVTSYTIPIGIAYATTSLSREKKVSFSGIVKSLAFGLIGGYLGFNMGMMMGNPVMGGYVGAAFLGMNRDVKTEEEMRDDFEEEEK